MSSAPFAVRTTPHFERAARALVRAHGEFIKRYEEALKILGQDPLNRSREYNILKLTNVAQGEGQYRFRLRRFRFRYDIYDHDVHDVVLHTCSLRCEDTY